MTNREESEAAEHETYPGPGPLRGDDAKRAIHPVEQMVDAAIDRIAREQEAARDQAAGKQGAGHTLARTSPDSRAALAAAKRAGGRLRWKGLDVSPEFRDYADRVARGEDLPPFTGKILAEPDVAFPWDAKARRQADRRVLKQQAGLWLAVAAFLGLAVWVLVVQVSKQEDWQKPAESPLANVVLSNQPAEGAAADQPGVEAPVPAAAPLEQAAPLAAAEPAAADEAGSTSVGTTALASLKESAPSVAAPSAPQVAVRPVPAAAAAPVLVATRAPTNEIPVPRASALPAASANGTAIGTPAGVAATSNSPAAASPAAVSAAGTAANGTSPAGAAGAGAGVAAAANPGAPDAPSTDAKKEPGREASAMGPLLVESPSF